MSVAAGKISFPDSVNPPMRLVHFPERRFSGIRVTFPICPLYIQKEKFNINRDLQNHAKITFSHISRLTLRIQGQIQLGMSFLFRFRHNLYPV